MRHLPFCTHTLVKSFSFSSSALKLGGTVCKTIRQLRLSNQIRKGRTRRLLSAYDVSSRYSIHIVQDDDVVALRAWPAGVGNGAEVIEVASSSLVVWLR